MKRLISLFTVLIFLTVSCSNQANTTEETKTTEKDPKQLEGLSKAYFASGCFWCVEAVYESVKGVEEAVSGYSGGSEQHPTYEQVGMGQTGHAETVEVYYDPDVVSFETLVKVYYGSQDPTQVNGQGPDHGPQYRSIIFYQNEAEKKIAEEYKAKVAKGFDKPVATEIVPFKKFWKAEDYHQDFERLHPEQSYVKAVSIPRLNRFKKKFPELLKEEAKLH